MFRAHRRHENRPKKSPRKWFAGLATKLRNRCSRCSQLSVELQQFFNGHFSGWLVVSTILKIWKSVGMMIPIYYGKIKNVPNHQPGLFSGIPGYQFKFRPCSHRLLLGGTSHHNWLDVVGRVANETPVSLAGTTAQSKEAGKAAPKPGSCTNSSRENCPLIPAPSNHRTSSEWCCYEATGILTSIDLWA